MQSKYIWWNGEIVPHSEATLHFLTPALHYGVSVFEGIRCYDTARGPGIFRLRDHIVRLVQSAKVLGWEELPFDAGELITGTKQVILANGLRECYIRPVAYLAEGGWNLNLADTTIRIGIAAWSWNAYLGDEARERGVRANVSSYTRHHPNIAMTKAKIAGNYPNSFLAKTESVRLGYDEAILLDPQGYVAECTGENLFVVRGKTLVTTPSAGILEGITRDTLVELARDLGYAVVEHPLSRDQLYVADEVFVCGTAAEVIGLREIDHRTIGCGKTGPVTASLQRAYLSAVRGELARAAAWIDYVGPQVAAERRSQAAPGASTPVSVPGPARIDATKTA